MTWHLAVAFVAGVVSGLALWGFVGAPRMVRRLTADLRAMSEQLDRARARR